MTSIHQWGVRSTLWWSARTGETRFHPSTVKLEAGGVINSRDTLTKRPADGFVLFSVAKRGGWNLLYLERNNQRIDVIPPRTVNKGSRGTLQNSFHLSHLCIISWNHSFPKTTVNFCVVAITASKRVASFARVGCWRQVCQTVQCCLISHLKGKKNWVTSSVFNKMKSREWNQNT